MYTHNLQVPTCCTKIQIRVRNVRIQGETERNRPSSLRKWNLLMYKIVKGDLQFCMTLDWKLLKATLYRLSCQVKNSSRYFCWCTGPPMTMVYWSRCRCRNRLCLIYYWTFTRTKASNTYLLSISLFLDDLSTAALGLSTLQISG